MYKNEDCAEINLARLLLWEQHAVDKNKFVRPPIQICVAFTLFEFLLLPRITNPLLAMEDLHMRLGFAYYVCVIATNGTPHGNTLNM